MSTLTTLDLRQFAVLCFAEDPARLPELLEAVGTLSATGAETWEEATRRLRRGDITALVLRCDDAERALARVVEASDAAPHLMSILVTSRDQIQLLLPTLHAGAIEQVVVDDRAAEHLHAALKSTLIRQALTNSTRAVVEALQAERAAAQREIEALDAELADVRRRLDRIAPTDGMTGLYNRRHLLDQWRREVARARRYAIPLSVIFVEPPGAADLSDDSLRDLATFLVRAIRDVDFVARTGDRQFAVVLPHCGGPQAESLASRLLERFAAESDLGLCAGTAALGEDGDDPAAVIFAAQSALDDALHR